MAIPYTIHCAVRSKITRLKLPDVRAVLSTLIDLANIAPLPNPNFLLEELVLVPMCSKVRPTPKARPCSKARPTPKARPKPQARPCSKTRPKPQVLSKDELVGIATRSKILMDGNVAEGTFLEVYPKKGVRARWFMCVITGELRWDEHGDPFIALCYWCEENTTTLDKKYPPVPCPVEWVMAMGIKSI